MKMIEEEVEGVMIHDKLQQLFVDEACETWTLYSDDDRRELLFHIMRHLSLGGGINQYDDMLEPYLNTARAVYKDMVAVVRNATSQKLEVASHAVRVTDVDGFALFPFDATQNFCLLAVDPLKRHVVLWYGAYVPPW
jgi:hypothetical protein